MNLSDGFLNAITTMDTRNKISKMEKQTGTRPDNRNHNKSKHTTMLIA
jgi:hypothetical protein